MKLDQPFWAVVNGYNQVCKRPDGSLIVCTNKPDEVTRKMLLGQVCETDMAHDHGVRITQLVIKPHVIVTPKFRKNPDNEFERGIRDSSDGRLEPRDGDDDGVLLDA